MSDENQAKKKTATRRPSFIAYQVREIDGEAGFFTRIGAAWRHADGKGFTVQAESLPLDGRIVLRIPSAKRK